MSAIAGIWRFGGGGADARACARMLNAQAVYAPDAPAQREAGPVAMGRRLWKLLPEDRFDRGPVVSAAGLLVADVRLDNRPELGEALGIGPADAAFLADSAILMKALERWGEAAVERLEGDFAFAWWDAARERLVLARDILGQRPLHYHRGEGFFAFASMPKGIHALPDVPYAPDRRTIADFLILLPESGPETFFEGIEKVRAGDVSVVTPGGVSSRRYWDPQPEILKLKSRGDYEEAIRAEMDRAVRVRLRGTEGRVAAHLSAGLDSATVAATAARLLAAEGGRVTAFTAAPREGYRAPPSGKVIADEWPLAAEVAAMHPNIDHVRIGGGGAGSPTADLGRYFQLFERPFLNLCNGVWMTATLEEAKARKLGVLLTGVFGNATFSYDGMHELHRLLKGGRLLKLAGEAARLKRGGTRLGTVASQALGPMLPRGLWRAVARMRGGERGMSAGSLIRQDRAEALRIEERAAERGLDLDYRPRGDAHEARLWILRRVDQGNYKKGTLGGWGIDLRDPAADRRLIELCLSIPPAEYLAGGRPRSLARASFADRLPAALLDERRKGLQAADWHEGLEAARGELGEEVEAIAGCAPAAEAIDTAAMQALVEDWPEGRWHERAVTMRYRGALLRGLSAGRFIRQAVGSNR
ncbi:MAG TPA: asparagine synthase-related protein [Allosphingosinicella sp.]|nr:asparagine synthase-related protein [Allosphingosinicella sp.]